MTAPSDDHQNKSGHHQLFEHLVPDRQCGDCVACCKILEISQPELTKAADVLCSHCKDGGCGIYENRPMVCRTWYCLWRRIDAMPDEARPDRANVVASIDRHDPPRSPFEKLYVVIRATKDATDFEGSVASQIIDMFVRDGSLPVWLSFGGNKILVHPSKPVVEAIVNNTAAAPGIFAEVQEWRKRLRLG